MRLRRGRASQNTNIIANRMILGPPASKPSLPLLSPGICPNVAAKITQYAGFVLGAQAQRTATDGVVV